MYITLYGDRLFAKNWNEFSLREMEDAEQIKTALINQLREKMKFPSTSSVTTTTTIQLRLALCENEKVLSRKVELGWMNYQDSMYKQVRRATGGVTRNNC